MEVLFVSIYNWNWLDTGVLSLVTWEPVLTCHFWLERRKVTTRQISTTTTTTTATSPPSSSPSVYTPGIVALMEIVTCRGCSVRPGEINLVLQGDGGPNITCAPSPAGGSLSSLACFQLGKALLPPAAGLNHINGLNGFGPGVLSPAGLPP